MKKLLTLLLLFTLTACSTETTEKEDNELDITQGTITLDYTVRMSSLDLGGFDEEFQIVLDLEQDKYAITNNGITDYYYVEDDVIYLLYKNGETYSRLMQEDLNPFLRFLTQIPNYLSNDQETLSLDTIKQITQGTPYTEFISEISSGDFTITKELDTYTLSFDDGDMNISFVFDYAEGQEITLPEFTQDLFGETFSEAIEVPLNTVITDEIYRDIDYMYFVIQHAGYYDFSITYCTLHTYIVVAEETDGGFSASQNSPDEHFLGTIYLEEGRFYVKFSNNVDEVPPGAYYSFSLTKLD